MKYLVGFASGLPSMELTLQDNLVLARTPFAAAVPEEPCEEYGDGAVTVLNGGIGWGTDGAPGAGATSGSRSMGGVTDRYVSITNNEIVHPFTPPATWYTMRVGALVGIPDSGGDLTAFQMGLGLCNGFAGGYMAGGSTHWVGMGWSYAATTFTRYAGPPHYYGSCGYRPMRKRNGTQDQYGADIATQIYLPANDGVAANRRVPIIVDLEKYSGGILVSFYYASAALSQTDFSSQNFWELMEAAPASFMYDSTGRQFNRQRTLASNLATFDEATYGTLNAFSLFWKKASPILEVFDFGVQRVA